MPAQPKIEMLENALRKATSQSDPQWTANALLSLLWHVAELRGDMPKLMIWLGQESGRQIVKPSYGDSIYEAVVSQSKPDLSRYICEIVAGTVIPHLASNDSAEVVSELAKLKASSRNETFFALLSKTVDLWIVIAKTNAKLGSLTVDIDCDSEDASKALNVGAHTSISFQRTLRVPEDGKEYPLPANMGTLPIYRIEDFADKVPPHWLEDGGFFIPLYQREALYIAFKGASWRPTVAKVAVGRINAITGKPYDERIRQHEQDYVIIPDQKWLDGINTGKNIVSQFVAMPIGQGYTIEEQVTDEAKHGGFQIVVFEPKFDRFPIEDPALTKLREMKAFQRLIKAKQDTFI